MERMCPIAIAIGLFLQCRQGPKVPHHLAALTAWKGNIGHYAAEALFCQVRLESISYWHLSGSAKQGRSVAAFWPQHQDWFVLG